MTAVRHVRLEELAAPTKNALVGGPFGSDLVSADYTPTGVPVIRGENVSVGRWVAGEFVYVSPEKAQALRANTAGPLDIIFTQRGANHYRQVAVVPPDAPQRFVISQSQMKLTVETRVVDPLFVYYLFRDPAQQEYLQRHAIQTGVPHTNLSILRNVPLVVPSLETQRAIVGVLGALDDKIELNHRMNETLESMARALFKSWFVDFNPVRAKAGRAPAGMDAATAALFPDGFEDSELAETPRGWKIGTLGDVADAPRRTVDPTELDGKVAYIGLEHMPRRSIALAKWEAASKVTSQKARFEAGDILFGKLRPYFHKVGVAPLAGVCSTDIIVAVPKAPEMFAFLLGHLSGDDLIKYSDQCSTGTKMPRVSWGDLARYAVVLPPAPVAAACTAVTRPLIQRMVAAIHESRTLAATRDALLPKLLSGELRVRDAERVVEQVA